MDESCKKGRKLDLIMSDPGTFRVICANVGATLAVSTSEKNNSSIDKYTVICIFSFKTNWRRVPYLNDVK